ncbi:hypothetical protein IKE88_01475 [Candidatus Saccharibacteria bacterium]|nr:hypothetical protein [Candidatus Saccharibacteria bacterium]
MRVGQKALEVIHYHTYMLAIIIGIRVGFSSRHRMASTGPLVYLAILIVTMYA